jgi:hypothetical protein
VARHTQLHVDGPGARVLRDQRPRVAEQRVHVDGGTPEAEDARVGLLHREEVRRELQRLAHAALGHRDVLARERWSRRVVEVALDELRGHERRGHGLAQVVRHDAEEVQTPRRSGEHRDTLFHAVLVTSRWEATGRRSGSPVAAVSSPGS